MQIKSQFKLHVNISGKTSFSFLKNVRIFPFDFSIFLYISYFSASANSDFQFRFSKLKMIFSFRCFVIINKKDRNTKKKSGISSAP